MLFKICYHQHHHNNNSNKRRDYLARMRFIDFCERGIIPGMRDVPGCLFFSDLMMAYVARDWTTGLV